MKILHFLMFFVLISPFFLIDFAKAGTSGDGFIGTIVPESAGIVLFYSNGQRYNIPQCASGTAGRWAINATSAAGQAMLAALLTAYAMGKKIEITGSGSCNAWGDTEDVLYFVVVD